MRLHPMHPAAWVLEELRHMGWTVIDLLAFTRASTLVLASRDGGPEMVVKAGFGSNHVLAALTDHERSAAYGFYWYQEMTVSERALTRGDFRHEIDTTRAATGAAHVVPMLDYGAGSEFDWYTMPYYPDGNFRQLLMDATARRHPDMITRGLAILADVAAGLTELHRRGIVHRDVYQENILIHHERGLITDLGAARHTHSPRGPQRRGPEVHWPPEYSTAYTTAAPAADVFSLAVLAYRLVCGDLPRVDGRVWLEDVPAVLRDGLLSGLAHNPGDRPTMPELREALLVTST